MLNKSIIISSYIVCTLLLISCGSEKKAKVEILLEFPSNFKDTLYLVSENTTNQKPIIDTIILKEGKAKLHKDHEETLQYQLVIKKTRSFKDFFISQGTNTIKVNDTILKDFKIEAGLAQKDFEAYSDILKVITTRYDSITRAFQSSTQAITPKMYKETEEALAILGIEKMITDSIFISNHKASMVTPYILLVNYISTQNNADKTIKELNALSKEVQESYYAKRIKNMISAQPQIGKLAIDFTQNTPDGKAIKLSDFKGKVVLLDFWASWCGPCRKTNPELVKLYAKFHPLGLEILSISLDGDKNKWVEAIEKDKLNWTHVSDLQGWGNEVAQMYKIQSIPQTILIDAEGKIIALNPEHEELLSILANIFIKK